MKNNKESKKSNEKPVPLREKNVKIHSDGKIDDFCFELIEILFSISSMLLTDKSELDHFDLVDEIAGHMQIKLSEVPEVDLERYSDYFETWAPEDLGRLVVWYPPISDEKWDEINSNRKKRLIKLIELTFNISMEDYPDDSLYVWKVARFIKKKLAFTNENLYYHCNL